MLNSSKDSTEEPLAAAVDLTTIRRSLPAERLGCISLTGSGFRFVQVAGGTSVGRAEEGVLHLMEEGLGSPPEVRRSGTAQREGASREWGETLASTTMY